MLDGAWTMSDVCGTCLELQHNLQPHPRNVQLSSWFLNQALKTTPPPGDEVVQVRSSSRYGYATTL